MPLDVVLPGWHLGSWDMVLLRLVCLLAVPLVVVLVPLLFWLLLWVVAGLYGLALGCACLGTGQPLRRPAPPVPPPDFGLFERGVEDYLARRYPPSPPPAA